MWHAPVELDNQCFKCLKVGSWRTVGIIISSLLQIQVGVQSFVVKIFSIRCKLQAPANSMPPTKSKPAAKSKPGVKNKPSAIFYFKGAQVGGRTRDLFVIFIYFLSQNRPTAPPSPLQYLNLLQHPSHGKLHLVKVWAQT